MKSHNVGTRITGSPVREWSIDAAVGGFDKEGKKKMDGISILLQYKVS